MAMRIYRSVADVRNEFSDTSAEYGAAFAHFAKPGAKALTEHQLRKLVAAHRLTIDEARAILSVAYLTEARDYDVECALDVDAFDAWTKLCAEAKSVTGPNR